MAKPSELAVGRVLGAMMRMCWVDARFEVDGCDCGESWLGAHSECLVYGRAGKSTGMNRTCVVGLERG